MSVAETTKSETAPGGGVSMVPGEVSPEQTASPGNRPSQADRRRVSLAFRNMDGICEAPVLTGKPDSKPTDDKKPPRHQPNGRISLAARLASRDSASAPWLCVAVVRRLCSEQRTYNAEK